MAGVCFCDRLVNWLSNALTFQFQDLDTHHVVLFHSVVLFSVHIMCVPALKAAPPFVAPWFAAFAQVLYINLYI